MDILSPEGVEERVKSEFIARVTMTGGGKYRVYLSPDDSRPPEPIAVHNTLEDAKNQMAEAMILVGSLLRDPQKTIELLRKGLDK